MDNCLFLENTFGLKGKTAVITGGGGILCSALGLGLSRAGVKIAVLDISSQASEKVAQAIQDEGGAALPVLCDVLDKTSLEQAAGTVQAAFGKVDFLINGAGGNRQQATTAADRPFFDLPPDAIRWVFDLNFVGMLLSSQVFGRLMCQVGEGAILNISSMNALRPLTRVPAYSAAKAAVSNFTQWLAVHLAQEYSPHIRVNAIAPGFFLTEQNRFLLIDQESGEMTPRGRQILAHTPMGCYGQPEDLLGIAIWLLSPSASFVTGVVVPVDGGFSAFSGV